MSVKNLLEEALDLVEAKKKFLSKGGVVDVIPPVEIKVKMYYPPSPVKQLAINSYKNQKDVSYRQILRRTKTATSQDFKELVFLGKIVHKNSYSYTEAESTISIMDSYSNLRHTPVHKRRSDVLVDRKDIVNELGLNSVRDLTSLVKEGIIPDICHIIHLGYLYEQPVAVDIINKLKGSSHVKKLQETSLLQGSKHMG